MDLLIDDAYDLFSSYTLGNSLEICKKECCITIDNQSKLIKTPLKQLSNELLFEYNTATVIGNNFNEIKYFLPRILELIVSFQFPHHSEELVLEKVDVAKTNVWSVEEISFLNKFSQQYFSKALEVYPLPNYLQIDSILILLAGTNIHIEPLLNNWLSNETQESTLHFSSLITHSLDHNDKLDNPFASTKLSQQLRDWIYNIGVRELFLNRIKMQLENKINNFSYTQQLSSALNKLELI